MDIMRVKKIGLWGLHPLPIGGWKWGWLCIFMALFRRVLLSDFVYYCSCSSVNSWL